jgi:hypothetical protein
MRVKRSRVVCWLAVGILLGCANEAFAWGQAQPFVDGSGNPLQVSHGSSTLTSYLSVDNWIGSSSTPIGPQGFESTDDKASTISVEVDIATGGSASVTACLVTTSGASCDSVGSGQSSSTAGIGSISYTLPVGSSWYTDNGTGLAAVQVNLTPGSGTPGTTFAYGINVSGT